MMHPTLPSSNPAVGNMLHGSTAPNLPACGISGIFSSFELDSAVLEMAACLLEQSPAAQSPASERASHAASRREHAFRLGSSGSSRACRSLSAS